MLPTIDFRFQRDRRDGQHAHRFRAVVAAGEDEDSNSPYRMLPIRSPRTISPNQRESLGAKQNVSVDE